MTQLMMWKRDGEWKFGIEHSESWVIRLTRDKKGRGVMIHELKSAVTDLQSAKPVPLDSITISKELWGKASRLLHTDSVLVDDKYINGINDEKKLWIKRILSENPHLVKPEPMKEPTGIFAVIKATRSYPNGTVCPDHKWVLVNGKWYSENGSYSSDWSELINPVLISEGVVK